MTNCDLICTLQHGIGSRSQETQNSKGVRGEKQVARTV